jgi:protein dithiol:quinone oxidoreductase
MKISPRVLFIAIALFCIALVVKALELQHGPERQQPCPLCILQRYGYLVVAFIALVAALHGRALRAYAGATALVAATGAGFAVWQLTKGSTMQSCVSDPIGIFVNGLPMANWFEARVFFATGGCADKYPPLLGLSVPMWSLICFAVLALIAISIAWRARAAGAAPRTSHAPVRS